MIIGVIKTKDLLLHPVDVVNCQGLRGYFKLLSKALSRKDYCFLDFIEITSRKLNQGAKKRKPLSA